MSEKDLNVPQMRLARTTVLLEQIDTGPPKITKRE